MLGDSIVGITEGDWNRFERFGLREEKTFIKFITAHRARARAREYTTAKEGVMGVYLGPAG